MTANHTLEDDGVDRPRLKPSRQLGQIGAQPSTRFAFAFEAPRLSVINITPCSPTASLPMKVGTRHGAFAPIAAASAGNQSDTGAGSSSTTLYSPGCPRSIAAAVACAASSMWRNDHTPAPPAVAQHQTFESRAEHRRLQVANGLQSAAKFCRRVGIERVVFGFDWASDSCVRPSCIALRNEAANTAGMRGRQQIVCPLGAQAIRHGEVAIKLPQIQSGWDCGKLMNDDVRLCALDDIHHGIGIQSIEHNGLSTSRAEQVRLCWRARGPNHPVSCPHQYRNESTSNRARGSCQKHLHLRPPLCVHLKSGLLNSGL